MLKVEKELLEATTSQQVAQLRQVELQYYVDQIGGIQTMATLLAGLTFTAFVSMDGGFDLKSLLFRSESGAYDGRASGNGTISLEPADEAFDAVELVSFVMEVLQVVAVAVTLGEMLYVMTETLIARLLGSRLALRGPDGSIHTATQHLAGVLANSTRHFILGLQWFLLSVVCHAVRGMHVISSVLVLCIIARYWNLQFVVVRRLAGQFQLVHATLTDFELGPDGAGGSTDSLPMWRRDQLRSGRSHGTRRASLLIDLQHGVQERTILAVRRVENFFNPLRDLHALFAQVDDTRQAGGASTAERSAVSKPTKAARNLIMREQRREELGALDLEVANQRSSAAATRGEGSNGGHASTLDSLSHGASRGGGRSLVAAMRLRQQSSRDPFGRRRQRTRPSAHPTATSSSASGSGASSAAYGSKRRAERNSILPSWAVGAMALLGLGGERPTDESGGSARRVTFFALPWQSSRNFGAAASTSQQQEGGGGGGGGGGGISRRGSSGRHDLLARCMSMLTLREKGGEQAPRPPMQAADVTAPSVVSAAHVEPHASDGGTAEVV